MTMVVRRWGLLLYMQRKELEGRQRAAGPLLFREQVLVGGGGGDV